MVISMDSIFCLGKNLPFDINVRKVSSSILVHASKYSVEICPCDTVPLLTNIGGGLEMLYFHFQGLTSFLKRKEVANFLCRIVIWWKMNPTAHSFELESQPQLRIHPH